MRTPTMLGDLYPVAVPGLLLVGAAAMLVMQTSVGPMIFGGPIVFLLLSLIVGTLVVGYLIAGVQEVLAMRWAPWALPPEAHLDDEEHGFVLSERELERTGYSADDPPVVVPVGIAYALERALAGAWGTPEGAGWDRVAFLQRVTLALATSALLAFAFLAGGFADGAIDPGLRSHGGTVLVLGVLTAWLVARRVRTARREAIIDLLADARALVMDRGEQDEVRRVFNELGIHLAEHDPGMSVSR